MKTAGLSILFGCAVGVILYLLLRPTCPPEGQVLVPQQAWDSILALANKPPEVRVDTVYVDRPVVTPKPQPSLPQPQPVDATDIGGIIDASNEGIYLYQDSLVKDDIRVWSDLWIQGTLLDRKWRYTPITTQITTERTVYVPKVVEVVKTVETARNAFYVYAVTGGNANRFVYGGGVDLATKQGLIVGYQYQRLGGEGFNSVRIGFRLRL